MKRYCVFGITLAICVIAATGGYYFYTQRYIPIRAVQPIVRLLDEGTMNSVARASAMVGGMRYVQNPDGKTRLDTDPHPIRLSGAGAAEVKRAMLRAMEKAKDPIVIEGLLIVFIGRSGPGEVVFRGEKEWGIIRAAAERQNAGPSVVLRYFTETDTNGVTILNAGGAHPIP
jgi:hypothetical protein